MDLGGFSTQKAPKPHGYKDTILPKSDLGRIVSDIIVP